MTVPKRLGTLAALILVCGALGTGCSTRNGPDPYQNVNEKVFGFNEGLDHYVLEPVATGWDFVMPQFVQTGVGNFFDNLRMLRTTLNDLLQGKPVRSGIDLARFGINTTLGIVGLVDVASMMEIPKYEEDFAQTLGVWGVPAGPYIVLPFLGPSTSRGVGALPVDLMTVPTAYGITVIDVINTRAEFLEEVAENRETAFDYYVFVRDAYLQNRATRVEDGDPSSVEDDADLYELEDDLYDLEEDADADPDDPTLP